MRIAITEGGKPEIISAPQTNPKVRILPVSGSGYRKSIAVAAILASMNNAGVEVNVIVIGGGAAGLMCALTAAGRGRNVLVLEGSNKTGKKILMSGGGRCNFTNLNSEPNRFASANPHFCKSALSRFTQRDFITLVEKHDIPYHEKTLGQLFCNTSSKDIVVMLLDECQTSGVTILTCCSDVVVSDDAGFHVSCSRGEFRCDSLVVATGGLSIPRMGASDFGYRLARQFGLRVRDTRAGLVPFMLTGKMQKLTERLSGISCDAAVTAGTEMFRESILFTHRGLSGPAALQASSYWQPGEEIQINLLPDQDADELLLKGKVTSPKSLLRSILIDKLPRALVLELQTIFWPRHQDLPLTEIPDDVLRNVAASLQHWSIKPSGTEGYRTAEVTLGGVDTDELSSKTMESKQRPGLYFIGEVVDVTGYLGGYNFQWAWSSGWAAGCYA